MYAHSRSMGFYLVFLWWGWLHPRLYRIFTSLQKYLEVEALHIEKKKFWFLKLVVQKTAAKMCHERTQLDSKIKMVVKICLKIIKD